MTHICPAMGNHGTHFTLWKPWHVDGTIECRWANIFPTMVQPWNVEGQTFSQQFGSHGKHFPSHGTHLPSNLANTAKICLAMWNHGSHFLGYGQPWHVDDTYFFNNRAVMVHICLVIGNHGIYMAHIFSMIWQPWHTFAQ